MDTWATDLGHHLQALEIDASLHTPAADEETGEEEPPKVAATVVVAGYEESLKLLTEDIRHLPETLADGLPQSAAKETVSRVVLCLSAHLGNHYWTSAASRQLARGLMDSVLTACGCNSTLELLIGRPGSHDSNTSDHVTSPYVSMVTRAESTDEWRGRHGVASGKEESSTAESRRERGEGEREAVVFGGGVIRPLLSLLRWRLTRETWKKQPTAKHALLWTVRQLKHPHLSPHLNSLLPPLLMLVDDHENYHKTLGLSALTHLISNTDSTELRWYGRAEVIYEAIKSMLYMREVAMIHALHSCLPLLLPVIEGPPPITVSTPRKPTRTDEVFRILLNNVEIESKIALRKAYIAHVSAYIEMLGIYTARHMKQVLRVVGGCVEFPDYCGEQTRVCALKTLLALMRRVWPRVPSHRSEILKILLRLVSDLCPNDDHIPDKPEIYLQLKLIAECLLVLQYCCGNMEEVYRTLQKDCGYHRGLHYCLETCLSSLELETEPRNPEQ